MTEDMPDTPHFDLHLQDIRDLFIAPDGDPFDPHYLEVSGIDELVNLINPLNLHAFEKGEPLRIAVYLPPEGITPTLEAETRAALDRHLAHQIRWQHNEVLATRRGGWRSLAYATVLSLIVMALLGIAYGLDAPGWIQAVAYAIFIVVAWVSMWWAAETLLFDWLASRRMMLVLEAIRGAVIEIRPEPAVAAVARES